MKSFHPYSESLDITDAITVEAWVQHEGDEFKEWECILAKGSFPHQPEIKGHYEKSK